MDSPYILLEDVTYGEPVAHDLLQELLALELIDYRRESATMIYIAEHQCDTLRSMLRLATELEINAAGIETIMHMRTRMAQLHEEVRRLRTIEQAYHAMRPAAPIEQL